jgi:single-strand DNA-binding protein
MNSFTLTAVGNLARNPELVAKGDTAYTRFCLVGNDYAGQDEEGAPREVVTSLWFVAFGPLGETIVRNSRKGDQLIIEARVRANTWTDKQGEKQYDHDFVVQGFRFGAPGRAKREEREARREDGTHRGDETGNGTHHSANSSENAIAGAGINGGSGVRTALVARIGGTDPKSGADARSGADPKSGADPRSAVDAKSGTSAKTGEDTKPGVDAAADTDGRHGTDPNAGANARVGDHTPANEKSGAPRVGRRAAAPPP